MKKYITILVWFILLFSITACGDTQNDIPQLNFENMKNQVYSVKALFEAETDEDILGLFENSYLSEDGNIIIVGKFSEVEGTYEAYCWRDKVYQIVFRWDEALEIVPDSVVDDVNSCVGDYVHHNEYWDIYRWENDNIEISFKTGDGGWDNEGEITFEIIYDEGYDEANFSNVSSISEKDYLSINQENVVNDITTIRRMMTYLNKPKAEAFIDYSDLVDDDWSNLVMPGRMFGIDGQYVFMYNRDTGIIYSVAFDWIPDNMEKHESHMVNCLSQYFTECYETDSTKGNGLTYYYHDWDATTEENWSVHLSMTSESGWLQFSRLEIDKPAPETHDCVECGREATDTYTNPFSNEVEYYCYSHYKEIIKTMGDMEQDVGESDYSKHTCMECSREGTHRYESFTGQTEYYCTIHYEELMDMLNELGIE